MWGAPSSGNRDSEDWKLGWGGSTSKTTTEIKPVKSSWGKGWGDSTSNNAPGNDSSKGSWGKGWGGSTSDTAPGNDSTSATKGSGRDSSTSNSKGNGWGSSTADSNGNGWGTSTNGWKAAMNIKNPFAKTENSESSDQQTQETKKPSLFAVFGVKEPPPAISFNFGTDKNFQSTNDPNLHFEKTGLKISSFNMPPPPPPRIERKDNDDEDDDSKELLPPVDAKTGEEGEEIIFNERARAFVLKEKEEGKLGYAEIGIGEFHFNYSKEHNCYRMTMRRDMQNIVLNARVTKEVKPVLSRKNVLLQIPVIIDKQDDEIDNSTTDSNKNKIKIERKCFRFENEEIAKKLYDLIVDSISKL